MFPGSKLDNSCLKCGQSGHRQVKCFQPIKFKVIAASKALFRENKQKRRNGTKRVLHKIVEGLQEQMGMDHSDADEFPASAFFQDSAENSSSTEEDVKEVNHALADIHDDDND